MVSIEQLKKLREETAVSLQDCKKALEECDGDIVKAKQILKKWGRDLAVKKAERGTAQGIVASYIHPNNKIGVLLEIGCETDFVAKSADFQNLAHEICLQIAAVRTEDVPLEEQPWIKDQARTIKDLISDYISKTGENIEIKNFTRYEI
jgi:elongation factor Ts